MTRYDGRTCFKTMLVANARRKNYSIGSFLREKDWTLFSCSKFVWKKKRQKEKEEENVNLTWTWFERYFDVASVKLESRWHFIRTRWLIFYSKWTKLKWCVLAKWNIEIALSTLYYFRSTNEISFRTYSYFRFPRIDLFFFFLFFFPQTVQVRGKGRKFFKRKKYKRYKKGKKEYELGCDSLFFLTIQNQCHEKKKKRKKKYTEKERSNFFLSPHITHI